MAGFFCFTAEERHVGYKVKDFLRNSGVSARTLTRLKNGGKLLLNGQPCFATLRLKMGDVVEIYMPPDEPSPQSDCDISVDIVFEDEYLLIINKLANMAVHPSQGNHGNTLADAVLAYYNKNGINSIYRPVNRLDKGTSGLMIVSKDAHVHKLLSDYISQGLLKRRYKAIIEGQIEPLEGKINFAIARKEGSIIAREVNPSGKEAITVYKTIKTNSERSFMDIKLLTGRTHQIRVHFSYLGHPLVGDWLYGKEEEFISRHALHSYQIEVKHPITGEQLKFEADCPIDMMELINNIC